MFPLNFGRENQQQNEQYIVAGIKIGSMFMPCYILTKEVPISTMLQSGPERLRCGDKGAMAYYMYTAWYVAEKTSLLAYM